MALVYSTCTMCKSHAVCVKLTNGSYCKGCDRTGSHIKLSTYKK